MPSTTWNSRRRPMTILDDVLALRSANSKTWRDEPEFYWLSRLLEEVGELAMALNDRHERNLPPDVDLELREIASIAINWLEMRTTREEADDE
jgi:NTP pyrophosphatase (non-canonical NTP hydrolase)